MSKFGDCFRNALNTEMNRHINLITSIKVLVVDHKMDFLGHVAEVLHSCSFNVTCVDHSGAALKLLSKKSSEFDLVLIDSGMSDVDVQTFLSLTQNMDVLPIVMSEQEDDAFLLEALKSGAFLVLKRPLTIDAVRHMRQDIIRERMHKQGTCKDKNMILKTTTVHENRSSGSKRKERGNQIKQVTNQINIDNNLMYESSDEVYVDEDDDHDHDGMKKKICLEWTTELHNKFADVVNELGEGKCFPNEILKRMDVPGLTRMQVASHLQKCRKSSDRRTTTPTSSNSYTLSRQSSNVSSVEVSERKFGSMPFIQTNKKVQEDRSTVIGINLSINGWQSNEKHKNEQTYKSLPMFMQKSIAPPPQEILFPLGNGIDSNQHESINSTITKTTNNYFVQAISGPHDVGQGGLYPYNFPSIARQTSDDFPDFLKDMEGNGPNDDLTINFPGYNHLIHNKDTTWWKDYLYH